MSSSYLVTLSICVDANNHHEAASKAAEILKPDKEYAYFSVEELHSGVTKEVDLTLSTAPKVEFVYAEPMTPFDNEWLSYLAS